MWKINWENVTPETDVTWRADGFTWDDVSLCWCCWNSKNTQSTRDRTVVQRNGPPKNPTGSAVPGNAPKTTFTFVQVRKLSPLRSRSAAPPPSGWLSKQKVGLWMIAVRIQFHTIYVYWRLIWYFDFMSSTEAQKPDKFHFVLSSHSLN